MIATVAPLLARLTAGPILVLALVLPPALWALANPEQDEIDPPEDAPDVDWLIPMP